MYAAPITRRLRGAASTRLAPAGAGRVTVVSHFPHRRPVMTQLATGAPPPPFTLPNQDGRPTSLSDFAGRHVLVWFFSRAFGRN